MLFLVIFAVVIVTAFVALYLWSRRSEREIEIPARELSEFEQHQRTLEGTIVTNIVMGQGGGMH